MYRNIHTGVAGRRSWRSATVLVAAIAVLASVVTTSAEAAAPAPATAGLVVHAGGIRTAVSTVAGVSDAVFQAVPVGGGAALTCTTDASGTCTITVATGLTKATRIAYTVSEATAPGGYYLDPDLDYGGSTAGTSTPYVFQTAPLISGSSNDIPGASANGSYDDTASPGTPFSGQLATSLNNPSASTSCGLKIALILDQSGSMAKSGKQASLKSAANDVITALTGTPSQMAIYTYAAKAPAFSGGTVGLTSMSTTATSAPLSSFVNSLPTPTGATNWDQGLFQAVTASKQYDLVVVLTDGNPTTDNQDVGGGSSTVFHNIESGIYSANAIKNLGSRLVAIGIGVAGGQENLRAISGPTLDSDYYLGSESGFGDVFKSLATGNCNGVLTVQKKIQDYQGNAIADSSSANGWNFAGSVSRPVANLTFPATATVNGATGFTQSTVTIPAGGTPSVSVTEALTSGYTFVGATCSVNGTTVPTTAVVSATNPGVSFVAAAGVPLGCTFTNQQNPPLSSLAVQKLDATSGAALAGASFQLYREATVGTQKPSVDAAVGSSCTTSGSPVRCVSAATLSFGTYYWVETAAPAGYVLPGGAGAYSVAYSIDAAHTGTPVSTLSVSDAQLLSSVAVTKLDATTGAALVGASFQLYREATAGTRSPAADTTIGSPCTTSGSPAGCSSAATLSFGSYYWVETAAPTGYLLPSGVAGYSAAYSIDATHTGTPVTTLSVSDAQLGSSLAVQKRDATTGSAVDGATFRLYREAAAGTQNPALDTTIGSPCTTSGSPAQCASAATLTFGTYYWVETVAPTGYVLPAAAARLSIAYSIDATHLGTPAATLTVTDAQELSSLAVQKLDATSGAVVSGASFQLFREGTVGTRNPAMDLAVGLPCRTGSGSAGCVSAATLGFGTYYWVETAAPTGYVLPAGAAAYSAATTIDATHTGTPAATVTVSDAEQLSSLAVQKLDATTALPIAGAKFQLYRQAVTGTRNPAGDTAIGAPCTTAGSPAGCVSAATLSFGSYYWVETAAPTGYVLPAGAAAYSAATTIDATHTGTPLATVTVTDAEQLSSLAVQKLDATSGAALAGASFQLYREATPGTQDPSADSTMGVPCTTGTTAATPADSCVADGLSFGSYYWVETAAPTGYALPAGPLDRSAPVTIDAAYAAAGTTSAVSVSDAQILSSLAVQKVDGTTGVVVDLAQFQLYRETVAGTRQPASDTAVGSACRTAAGTTPADSCVAAGLSFGSYYWVETAAPTGYLLPSGTSAFSAATTIDAAYAAAGAVAIVSVTDAQVRSTLTVRKTDDTGSPLSGATFQLWRDTNAAAGLQLTGATADTEVTDCTTTADGTCTVTELAFGTYYWVETQAPTFYELPDNPISAAVAVTAGNAGSAFDPVTFADPSTPVATVQKTVRSTIQNADGTWTITYDLAVTNPSAKYTTQYVLTDALAFGTGITVDSATVAGPADATPADPAWDGAAQPTVISGRVLDPSSTEHYTVTVNATVAPDANRSCTDGGGFANSSQVSLQAAGPQTLLRAVADAALAPVDGPGQHAAACSEPVSPTIDKTFGTAEQHLVGGAWDGSWDVTYTVTVANPSTTTGLVYSLSDKPAFPADTTLNGGTVTGSEGAAKINTVAPDWNGTSRPEIVTARPLPASGTDTYTVVVNATVPPGADAAELPCTDGGSGHGFFNEASAVSGSDTVTADGCGDIPQLPMPVITKSVTANVQNADGSWTVTYDLAVSNPDGDLASTYGLSDALDFGTGITVNSAAVTGPAGVTIDADWNGADKTGIVTGQVIAADVTEHYTVTVNATVTAAATTTGRDCTLTTGENGTGFLNGATLTLGAHSSTSIACTSPGSPTVVKRVVSVTPANPFGGWTVAYSVTVANATATDVTYSLVDDPGFAPGVQITGTTVSSSRSALDGSAASAPADLTGWTGTAPHDGLAADRLLPAGSKDTYLVSMDVTVPPGISAGVLACSAEGSGHGYFNQAVLTSGGDTFPVSACARIHNFGVEGVSTHRPPHNTDAGSVTGGGASSGGGLAVTGMNVLPLALLGVGAMIAGVCLLLLIGRRRRTPRDVG